jgi:hypothetical protein
MRICDRETGSLFEMDKKKKRNKVAEGEGGRALVDAGFLLLAT